MSIRATYFAFAEAHPELFENPPEGGFTILLNEAEICETEAYMAQRLETGYSPIKR